MNSRPLELGSVSDIFGGELESGMSAAFLAVRLLAVVCIFDHGSSESTECKIDNKITPFHRLLFVAAISRASYTSSLSEVFIRKRNIFLNLTYRSCQWHSPIHENGTLPSRNTPSSPKPVSLFLKARHAYPFSAQPLWNKLRRHEVQPPLNTSAPAVPPSPEKEYTKHRHFCRSYRLLCQPERYRFLRCIHSGCDRRALYAALRPQQLSPPRTADGRSGHTEAAAEKVAALATPRFCRQHRDPELHTLVRRMCSALGCKARPPPRRHGERNGCPARASPHTGQLSIPRKGTIPCRRQLWEMIVGNRHEFVSCSKQPPIPPQSSS